ncbi:hypothetical protein AVEN_214970-1 [Araneus ventricosus]|uniref:Serine aminopeptidase S33 domain-containing protein n=1 Tax=Araneus ventricosus TaxID=182803 RepID=A0A4Y2NZQ5_ARAVE|nr:hypothetical protein AVEN_214970-1 [Araneus ventricosus]
MQCDSPAAFPFIKAVPLPSSNPSRRTHPLKKLVPRHLTEALSRRKSVHHACSRNPKRFPESQESENRLLLLETYGEAQEISAKFPEIKVPFLVLHGCQDKICHVDGSRRLFELASSTDKGLKVYPLGYHSLLNEPDDISTDVVESIVEWFERRVDY